MVQALQIEHLVKDYGSLRAVNDVTFDTKPGEIFGLLGPNGAGKTSIISCIVTLERATSGRVKVFGHEVNQAAREAKVRTGLVPQELVNHGYFTVHEILRFHSGYYGLWNNEDQITYLLKRLALWGHRNKRVKQLSGGMKRRLLIAKALVHKPRLLLLDEPTAGVDIELRSALWEFVRDLKKQNISILLTTHYLEEAEQLCDRVGILNEGHLKAVGDTKDLVKTLTQREVCFFIDDLEQTINHPMLVHQGNSRLVFRIPASMRVGDLLADLNLDVRRVRDLQIAEGNLEDAFRSVLGGPLEI